MITPEEMQAKILKLMEESAASKLEQLEAKMKRDGLERKINNASFALSVYHSLAIAPLVIAAAVGGEK